MSPKYCTLTALALALTACAQTPPPFLAGPAEAPVALQAIEAASLLNPTASSTYGRNPASHVLDGDPRTRWLSGRAVATATLTAELNIPAPLPLASLTLNTDPFPTGTSYDVQTSLDGVTFTTVLAAQTKLTAGSVTMLIPPGPAATAKFVRVVCKNRDNPRQRVGVFGIAEMSATVDVPPPPPPPPPVVEAPEEDDEEGPEPELGVVGAYGFQSLTAEIPQYRPLRGRLRFEAFGQPSDPATLALNALAEEALFEDPAPILRGRGRMVVASTGFVLCDIDVLMAPLADEPGVVVGDDAATGNEVEVIWPRISEGLDADAIVRVQMGSAPLGLDGQEIRVDFTIEKLDHEGLVVASWTASGVSAVVPAARLR